MRSKISDNLSLIQIVESWVTVEGTMHSMNEILNWINRKNEEVHVSIRKIDWSEMQDWYYDTDEKGIVNRSHAFFKVAGLQRFDQNGQLELEQPIIIQNEIGYLGIIGKVFDGIMYFLMQAKIEPGNINKIQISPTVQATKSNFMCVHGGRVPRYIEYFSHKSDYEVIVDQIQSEQSSRFYGKRNRNIIIVVDGDISVAESHMWMTLGQIKQLMEYDNLVNMDTRTVISCIPFALRDFTYKELIYINTLFTNQEMYNSIFLGDAGSKINKIYQYVNEIKMLDSSKVELTDLNSLRSWQCNGDSYTSLSGNFKVIFCDIEIEGREVRKWQQPLLEAKTISILGLIFCVFDNKVNFLVHCISEVGCFDKVEIGPTMQCSDLHVKPVNHIEKIFIDKYEKGEGIVFSGLFSEEGGRFYHEENRNVLMQVQKAEIGSLPSGYFWADYQTLNILIQFNNCLNIQLRNLLSIWKI